MNTVSNRSISARGSSAGVGNVFVLIHTGALHKQVIGKPLFLRCQALHGVKSGPSQGLQDFITIDMYIDLLVDPAESEVVGNDKGVPTVILRQIRIGFFELFDFPGIEDMDRAYPCCPIAVVSRASF